MEFPFEETVRLLSDLIVNLYLLAIGEDYFGIPLP